METLDFEVLKKVPAWGFKIGDKIPVYCDNRGIPVTTFWRKRFRDKDIGLPLPSKPKKKASSEASK